MPMNVCTMHIHTCSSYMTIKIGVHERMYPYVTNLFCVSLHSQLAYLTDSHNIP